MSKVVLQCEGLSRVYEDGDRSVTVLRGVDLTLLAGEKIAVVGGSGSGKSTLLNLLGGLDNPSSGRVLMNGKDLSKLDERALCQLRNSQLGFVYQFHYLLEDLTIFENCELTFQILQSKDRAANHQSILAIFDELGISHLKDHYPFMLSGGERQRA